jgi:peptidoglycan/LPS O-acetylase OafA/YrhL
MLRLRSGPQDLPAGWLVAVGLTVAYFAQGLYADQLLGQGDGGPRSLVAIAVQFGVIVALLKRRNLESRAPQSLAALAGTGFLFGLLALLIIFQLDPEKPRPELVILYFGLFLWSLTVDGHIYRHALSVTMRTGMLLAVLIFSVNFMLLRALFE